MAAAPRLATTDQRSGYRHRDIEPVSTAALQAALLRTPLEHYLYWTGDAHVGHEGSLRTRALNCLHEAAEPVRLRVILQRAARLDGDLGLHPDIVRDAIKQHQLTRPASYFLLERTPAGDYVAAGDIPCPAGGRASIARGSAVLDRRGKQLPQPIAEAFGVQRRHRST